MLRVVGFPVPIPIVRSDLLVKETLLNTCWAILPCSRVTVDPPLSPVQCAILLYILLLLNSWLYIIGMRMSIIRSRRRADTGKSPSIFMYYPNLLPPCAGSASSVRCQLCLSHLMPCAHTRELNIQLPSIGHG